jgi:hypothetical protein
MPDSVSPASVGAGEERRAEGGDEAVAEHHQVQHDGRRQPRLAVVTLSAARREKPQPLRASSTAVRATSAAYAAPRGLPEGQRSDGGHRPEGRHRGALRTVAQDREEPLLQADPGRLDGVHLRAEQCQVPHEGRHRRAVVLAGQRHGEPSPSRSSAPVRRRPLLRGRR